MTPVFPKLGFGVGLRRQHFGEILADPALAKRVDWFEAISENFMVPGGKPLDVLEKVRATHPVALHGVSLSIGSADPINEKYLAELAALTRRFDPAIVSDHLCWGSIGGRYAHDLLPLAYSEGEADRIADRIRHVQNALGRRILIENVSSYLTWKHSSMPEWDFVTRVAEKADCGILLDVNNIYVSARNHRFDPLEYLAGVPRDRVGQFHLAGHEDKGTYLFDTHDGPVIDPVWKLYEHAVARFGDVPTLIEWDDKIPEFAKLADESDRAKKHAKPLAGPGGHEPRRTTRSQAPATISTQATQEIFWDLITAPQGASSAASAPRIEELIAGDALPAVERADIYANMYFARLLAALEEDFPAVLATVGHDRFHDLVTDYVLVHPSRNPSLRHLGSALAAFLAGHRVERSHPWIGALAALEWARVESFDAKDAAPLDPARLAAIAPDKWASLRFVAHPSLRIVPSKWRVDHPWKQVDEDGRPSDPAKADGAIRIWREEHTVFHAWMEPLEAKLLGMLVAGETFAAICDAAAAEARGPEEAAAKAFGFLRGWLSLIDLR